MSEGWSSLYVRASEKDLFEAMQALYKGANYEILLENPGLDELTERIFIKLSDEERRKIITHFWVSTDNNPWLGVVGFGEMDYYIPPTVFASDVVSRLKCDALYIGFIDTLSWWYYIYKEGKLIDVFDSDPGETLFAKNYYLEPDDPRILYNKKLNSPYNYSFPDDLLDCFKGDPQALVPFKKHEVEAEVIEKAWRERWPENAISKLSKGLILPGFGRISTDYIIDYVFGASSHSQLVSIDETSFANVGGIIARPRL